MAELEGQIPMFEVVPIRPPKARRQLPPGKPRWTDYRPMFPFRCDDCAAVLAENDGHGPPCRKARWKRIVIDNELLLCSAHAEDRRVEDALPPLRKEDL